MSLFYDMNVDSDFPKGTLHIRLLALTQVSLAKAIELFCFLV